jgi:putative ABC transport system substrate-binding protein
MLLSSDWGRNMLRRDFIALLGGVSAMWPSAARGQQPARMKRIAMLLPYLETDPEAQARVAAFRESLNQLGWLEGKNVDFQSRWATDDPERLRADTAELIGLQPDVIVTPSTLATSAVKRVTSTTPIVFINVIDPIGSGFAVSLARPGGNLTGFATIEASMGGKWLELLTAVAPRTKRAALLFGAANTAMTSGGSLSQIFDAATSAFPGISFFRARRRSGKRNRRARKYI